MTKAQYLIKSISANILLLIILFVLSNSLSEEGTYGSSPVTLPHDPSIPLTTRALAHLRDPSIILILLHLDTRSSYCDNTQLSLFIDSSTVEITFPCLHEHLLYPCVTLLRTLPLHLGMAISEFNFHMHIATSSVFGAAVISNLQEASSNAQKPGDDGSQNSQVSDASADGNALKSGTLNNESELPCITDTAPSIFGEEKVRPLEQERKNRSLLLKHPGE